MKTAASSLAPQTVTTLLTTSDPEAVYWEMQQVQLATTRRAYELFQIRGGEHGHDWEDWFRAESELLRPVSTAISVSLDRISVRANVLGFGQHELKIAIEPKRLLIVGRREGPQAGASKKVENHPDWCPDQIMRAIDLPVDVVPEGAIVELQAGLLKFELPRATPLGATVPGESR